ncbi:serine protease inhibitor swm-1 [Melitaea cinxia]|uniref:serine protease inhibitor swm-1 n=1 Tax=Melitaea cinxia TaxID=113334 RepID=UPI001E2715C4|nr:serine protease inhibitor swm-1 [Melitaea cinxia]
MYFLHISPLLLVNLFYNNCKCPPNEEYLLCGSACPANCTSPIPADCSDDCVEGCFCLTGYLRNENGTCVNIDECDTSFCFNNNEVFDICNASCEPSCTDPEPICTKVCASGCICATGLLRSPEGDCVSVDKCSVNGTAPGIFEKYLNTINKILHLTVA